MNEWQNGREYDSGWSLIDAAYPFTQWHARGDNILNVWEWIHKETSMNEQTYWTISHLLAMSLTKTEAVESLQYKINAHNNSVYGDRQRIEQSYNV